MWGLSNFFDESRRNHSPAFVPMDTSTNSSTAAVKEEPVVVPTNPRESYSLVDDDLGNGVLQDQIADPIPNFLELDTPVNIKNEILSPITSPVPPSGPSAPQPSAIRGPRTPPSPSYPMKDDSREIKKSSMSSGNVQTETSISVELTVPQSQISKHSNVQQSSCDTKEDTGKVQISTARKLRLSKNKNETFSPRNESSPPTQSVEDNEPSASKGLYDASFNKDNVNIDINVMTSSCSVPSETSESSHENYSIKTRQKVSKSSSAKKAKILSEESLCDSGQKGNTSSKSPVPKFKHPTRTCRASNETKQLSKALKGPAKSDPSDEPKTPFNKSDLKEKNSSEKTKIMLKPVGNTKGLSKNSVKIKKKPQKISPKQTEGKKEVKRKKNKFHIENFLQSPTISQSETGQLSKVSSVVSPSRDKSPIPDYKSSSDSKRKPSVSPSHAPQSPNKLSTKSVEKGKNVEKLRRSARCSERASSIAQAESSVVCQQDTELSKKSTKRTPKWREPSGSPAHIEAPPLLLSPIPHMSPIPMTSSECAIPDKIMVCIPLDKLSRLPIPMHALDTESKSVCKLQPVEEIILKKDDVLLEKSSKNPTNKRAVLKDIKDKPRTDISSKGTQNKSNTIKKDKSVKTVIAPISTSLSKTASSVNSKTSIKTADGKSSWNASEIKISKKRKSEDDKQLLKKKAKTHSEQSHDRNQHMSSRTESPNHTDVSCKPKSLERCDSVSSLSSLGSQVSQRSSKEKKKSTTVSDTKRVKSLPVKHIKQEKEEKIKTVIKKEPGTPDKKEKSRDKLISKDTDQKPILEPSWSDTSSQYCPWDDPCKEDSKGTLPIASSLLSSITRVCGFDWDHFGPEGKDKEASNKHNNPLMPMDYYYTEGRKQRHLAEREKDPFLQTLKYFEATVLFILTSQQREEYTKEPESVYQFYRETLNFSNVILQNVRIQQSSPGSTEFKLLILLLRCQALLNVKLYSLKIKEVKEQQKTVADFFQTHCPASVKGLSHPTPPNPRLSLTSVPSPHSPTPSPASSVNSQTSGYSSSDISGNHLRNSLSLLSQSVNVTQSMLEMICRQHTHLYNLHMGHDLWEQADMYMTRSNLREFFKEVADQSENLTLHSSIKDLVNYVQTGISLVKKCSR